MAPLSYIYTHQNYRSLLQKSPIKETIFAQETCNIKEPTNRSHRPIKETIYMVSVYRVSVCDGSFELCRALGNVYRAF